MAEPAASGLVDASGRLLAADRLLARLQGEAGASIGGALAVPQLAALARLVQKLGITVSRQALAGTRDVDLDLWVRAEPEGGNVRLTIERWTERPPQPPRWPTEEESGAAERDDTFELDRQLNLVAVPAALQEQLGMPEVQALGAPLTRFMRLKAHEDGSLPLLAAVATRTPFKAQRAILHGDPEFAIELSGEPIEDPDGAFAGFRGRITLLSGEKQGPLQSVSAFDELLREPLDTIINEAEQIAGRSDGPLRSDYAAYASDIASAGRHLLEVLRSLGKEPVEELERVDLVALAREAVGLVQPRAEERGVRIEQEGPPELAVRAHARPVTQILVNLIGNAVRHSPDGGLVRVIVREGDLATVTVADEGRGVADRDRERIFERFEQAEPRGEGAGLGLAISRRLARSLGGDISLDSREGEGARFTLSLPLN